MIAFLIANPGILAALVALMGIVVGVLIHFHREHKADKRHKEMLKHKKEEEKKKKDGNDDKKAE